MKSPKNIETSRSMRGQFFVPVGGYIHMIPHEQTICNNKSVCLNRFVCLHKKGYCKMDITLTRILSLIPKKDNGDFKHGELAKFARSLGFKDGHIISDWIAGNSESYKNYIYQISSIHNVSVEWLKGESEQKEKPTTENGSELSAERIKLMLSDMTAEDLSSLIADAASELAKRNGQK